jgi:hypothetical protein
MVNRVARLAARRQPSPPIEKGFEKVRVVGTRAALPEREDVNAGEDEGERADAEAESRRVGLLPKEHQGKTDAQEQPARMKRMLIPSMPQSMPSLSCPAWVLMTGMLIFQSRW